LESDVAPIRLAEALAALPEQRSQVGALSTFRRLTAAHVAVVNADNADAWAEAFTGKHRVVCQNCALLV
jgi:hypothetical protein